MLKLQNANPRQSGENDEAYKDRLSETFRTHIAENLFSQVDDEGHQFFYLKEIIDHRKDGRAITKENGFTKSKNGNIMVPKITTIGWDVLVEWKDGATTWVPMKHIKESNPVELAEFFRFRAKPETFGASEASPRPKIWPTSGKFSTRNLRRICSQNRDLIP